MVVRAGVSSGECAEVILDVERLKEVDVLPCEELEDVADKPGSGVGLRDKHRAALVEPRMVEPGAASGHLESGGVDVVVDHQVGVGVLGQFREGERRDGRTLELAVLHVVHHPVAACQLVAVGLQFLFRDRVDDIAVD